MAFIVFFLMEIRYIERNKILFDIADANKQVQIKCSFLESGIVDFAGVMLHPHAPPPFSRVFIIQRGSIEVQMSHGNYLLTPGKIALLPAGQPFDLLIKDCRLHFHHLKVSDETGLSVFRFIKGTPIIDDDFLFRMINEQYGQGERWRTSQWQAQIMCFLMTFLQPSFENICSTSARFYRYRKIIRYVCDNLSPELRIEKLADMAGVSRSALSKGFRKYTGQTFKSYLNELLIDRAQELLIGSEDTVQEIAFKLGYIDPYYFQRFFRKQTGIPPAKYRKMVLLG